MGGEYQQAPWHARPGTTLLKLVSPEEAPGRSRQGFSTTRTPFQNATRSVICSAAGFGVG